MIDYCYIECKELCEEQMSERNEQKNISAPLLREDLI